MKVITIHQPYAELIACGNKRVENRTWPIRYRGPLLIHAGKTRQRCSKGELASIAHITGIVIDPSEIAFGAIVARAELIDCVPYIKAFGRDDLALPSDQPHIEGPWCWILQGVQRLKPAYCPGSQGLWDYEGELSAFV